MRRARAWFGIVRAIGCCQRALHRLEAVCQRRGAAAQLAALNTTAADLAARIAAKRGRQ
jgi:hypothetical protein